MKGWIVFGLCRSKILMAFLEGKIKKRWEEEGYSLVKDVDLVDYYLHEYETYEEYKETQIKHNLRKIKNVWADEGTLDVVSEIVMRGRSVNQGDVKGLCHGTRNGFEQKYLSQKDGFDVLGTDISPSASEFDRSYVWDFHNVNPKWEGQFDFVYSNSLDQAWNPRGALETWLGQLKPDGVLIIEHTEVHGPSNANEMDPFGVRPKVMPYVLVDWFGRNITIEITTTQKTNMSDTAWLFAVRKTNQGCA